MKKVEIYSTPGCIHCQHAKKFFTDNDIEYTDHNVAEDVKKRQEMLDRSEQTGVPVIFVDEEMVIGFNEAKLKSLLEIA
ncbi:MAG: glutaredoxin domain-containing protein [Candidatus Paceibacterota bacterium]